MEQRAFERVPRKLEIRYCSVDDPDQIQREVHSDDIGRGGIRMDLDEDVSVGQRLRFAIRDLPNGNWSSEIEGIVAWQRSHQADLQKKRATGICFSSDQILINHYLTQLMTKNLSHPIDRSIPEENLHLSEMQVEPAYDGSKKTYKLLRFFGWGPLNNLGYFRFPSPFEFANLITSYVSGKALFLLPEAQRRLVVNSVKLLNVEKGDKVLDVACGKGMSSFILASMHPHAIVTGVDLLPNNINAARALYGGAPNLRFLVDDAMNLRFGAETINKIMCVEAAFHFPDRRKFINESYRILKPSSQLVIVDFMWTSDQTRLPSGDEQAQLVKSEWQWNDFFSITDYLQAAEDAGFRIQTRRDWSAWVTGPLGWTFKAIALLGNTYLGRLILNRLNPLLKSLFDDEWKHLLKSASAHDYVRKHLKYVALVLTK